MMAVKDNFFLSFVAIAAYKGRKKASMKSISINDEKILDQAIEIANEMSAR